MTLKEGGRILRAGDFLKDGVYQEFCEQGVKIRGTEAYNKNHPKDQCVGFLVEMDGKKLYFAATPPARRPWRRNCRGKS